MLRLALNPEALQPPDPKPQNVVSLEASQRAEFPEEFADVQHSACSQSGVRVQGSIGFNSQALG